MQTIRCFSSTAPHSHFILLFAKEILLKFGFSLMPEIKSSVVFANLNALLTSRLFHPNNDAPYRVVFLHEGSDAVRAAKGL